MTDFNRRTVLKSAGTSLLGLTVTNTASAKKPDNRGVHLLEVWPSFTFGDIENLEKLHSDGPLKYTIAPNQGTMQLQTVSKDEAKAAKTADRLTNFQGIQSGIDSIGGVTLNKLFLQGDIGETRSTFVSAVDGYEMPELDVNSNGNPLSQLLSADQVEKVEGKNGFHRVRLPSQQVKVKQKIVKDELVDDDSIPEWQRSVVIERPTATVEVDPYLTVAFHSNLDVVGVN